MQNNKLNIVVGKPCNGDTDAIRKTDCHGIDFVYHTPYFEIYLLSSKFIIGEKELPSTETFKFNLVT
jgi:hypothetical protein